MIRKLEEKDITKIVELEEKIFGETLGVEMLHSELSNPLVWFRVIENENQVVGYIGGYFYDGAGEIINFLIDDIYQRKGYGTLLFNSLIEESRVAGIKQITLEVKETNIKGINFYTKNEFKQISVRKHYYKDGENALVMMKEIK